MVRDSEGAVEGVVEGVEPESGAAEPGGAESPAAEPGAAEEAADSVAAEPGAAEGAGVGEAGIAGYGSAESAAAGRGEPAPVKAASGASRADEPSAGEVAPEASAAEPRPAELSPEPSAAELSPEAGLAEPGSAESSAAEPGAAGLSTEQRRARRGTALRRTGRTAAGLLGVAAVAAVVVLNPQFGDTAPALVRDRALPVEASPLALVCPGPARLTDPSVVGDAQFRAAPVGTVSAVRAIAAEGSAADLGSLDGTSTKAVRGAVSTGAKAGSARLLTAAGGADVAATVASVTAAGDLRGLSAASCAPPGVEHWLVGGGTKVGSSTQLVLQNPGRTPATVWIEVWGGQGRVPLVGGAQRVVGPGQEVVAQVEAMAPEQRRVVVHVSATGGLIAAYLQTSALDGLIPMGIDDVVPGAAPGTTLTIAGVRSDGQAVGDDHAPHVRLLAPDNRAATVRVEAYGPQGAVPLRGAESVPLAAGAVTDLSLGGLPAGSYVVTVRSDVPVVAGAFQDRSGPAAGLRAGDLAYDRAWIAAEPLGSRPAADADDAAAVPDEGMVALVAGTVATATIAAVPLADAGAQQASAPRPGAATVTVRALGSGGRAVGSKQLTIQPGTARTVTVAEVAGAGSTVLALAVERSGATSGPAVAWSVVVTAGAPAGGGPGTFWSVLLPTRPAPDTPQVTVRASDTAGVR